MAVYDVRAHTLSPNANEQRPSVVQAVRSIDDRAIASDLAWTPTYEKMGRVDAYWAAFAGRIPDIIYQQ